MKKALLILLFSMCATLILELWIKHVKSNGYEIIDIGYPQGEITESIFFNMERSVLNLK